MIGLEVNAITASVAKISEFPYIPDLEIDFDVDPTVPPTRHAYVSIPVHHRTLARERLSVMEANGIIEKVKTAPRWISGLSAVPKGKNNFRLVVNMRGPNKAIRRQFHNLPRVEEIKVTCAGAKLFTKLDISSAYHHVKLSERSRELTTFMGPDGMYRFTRLVFGVNCAPEIFQRIMENILTGIPKVVVYLDDILIFAENIDELNEITEKVLSALKRNNLTLNTDKCEYAKASLKFIGHRISARGLDIDEQKVHDIMTFRSPQSTSELKGFLGLASFVSAYIPRFADLTEPLRSLLKKKEFCWEEEHDLAFANIKKAIIECTVSQGFFVTTDETFLYTDASPYALGAVLVQANEVEKNRIISFAAKALTETEKRYPQTQREALAVVWAAEHFYYYLLGQKFTIRTDAQGIAFIFRRNGDAPKRLLKRAEGWAMRLDAFDFNIEFVSGSENIADAPSRLYTGTDEAYDEKTAPCEIASLTIETPAEMIFGDDHMPAMEVAHQTANDDELKRVLVALETDEWTPDLARFKAIEEELHTANGIIMRTGLAVIPRALRPKAMCLAHKGHPGMSKMKSILKERVWWPGMSKSVETWVESCRTCTLNGRKEPPTPMKRADLPEAPWDLVAVDFCGPYAMYGGIYVLGMVDYYTRYMIATPVASTDFASTRRVLSQIFDVFGYSDAIKSDNGPPFNSTDYRKFCTDRGITPVFSWPLDPQQNGMAERSMQTIDKAMKSASIEGGNFRAALADAMKAYNSAAHRVTNVVPENIMFGRRVRRSLPLTKSATVIVNDEEIRKRDHDEKEKAKQREDAKRSAREPNIAIGDKVVLRRATKRKGETNYDPTELEVVDMRRGDLTMVAPGGNVVRRNITMAKKIVEGTNAETIGQTVTPTNQRTSGNDDADEGAQNQRPKRNVAAPGYLKNYVRVIEENPNDVEN